MKSTKEPFKLVVLVSTHDGLVSVPAASLQQLETIISDTFGQDTATSAAVRSWAETATLGDALDWPGGWVFAVREECARLSRGAKASERARS